MQALPSEARHETRAGVVLPTLAAVFAPTTPYLNPPPSLSTKKRKKPWHRSFGLLLSSSALVAWSCCRKRRDHISNQTPNHARMSPETSAVSFAAAHSVDFGCGRIRTVAIPSTIMSRLFAAALETHNSVSHKRPTVVDADGYLSTVIEVLDFDLRAKWQ
jgi:hypothetical protein